MGCQEINSIIMVGIFVAGLAIGFSSSLILGLWEFAYQVGKRLSKHV